MKHLAFALLLSLLFSARAIDHLPASGHSKVQTVIGSDYISVPVEGTAELGFEAALSLFLHEDMLGRVQEVYADLLPEGEQPEFVVEQEAPSRWAFVNKRRQHSVITEIHRGLDKPGQLELLYHVEGKRFFGEFESLIHLKLQRGDADGVVYEVMVYAYPKVALSRFFARHLGLIERYFQSKTGELTALTVQICRILAEQQVSKELVRLR